MSIESAKKDVKAATLAAKADVNEVKDKVVSAAKEVKETVAKKATAAKKATKAATTRKTADKVSEKVFVQFAGKEATSALLIQRSKEAWIAEGGKAEDIKNVSVYVKFEENKCMVYYVINDSAGSFEF